MDGVGYTSTPLLSAGTATCASTDNKITTTQLFSHVSVINDDSTNSMTIAVGESSVGATNPIVIKAGESFSEGLLGEELHYSASSGTPSFRYVLR